MFKLWNVRFAGEEGAGGTTIVAPPAGAIGSGTPEAPHGSGGPPPVDPPKVETPAPKVETPPPRAAAPAPKSGADGGGTLEPGSVDPPKAWPDNWRELSNPDADKKLAARLAKMDSPLDIVKSYRSLETELSSGKYAKQLPTHYTAEELADYKKAHGIPEKASDYDDNLGNGIVWGDSDKQHIDNFKEYALENNMTPEEVKRGLGWWASYQETLVNEMNDRDVEHAAKFGVEARAAWGANERRNLNFVKNQFEQTAGAWATIANARDENGLRLGDNFEIMKLFADKFKQGDPEAFDLPGNGSTPAQSLDQEMAEIRKLMPDKNSRYWKGPDAAPMQERYRALIERRERQKGAA